MSDYNELQLGWCIGYMALKYHMEDALIENNENTQHASWDPPYAIFSKKYYNEINALDHTKKYDYCFIGSINSNHEKRQWVIEFAKKNFTPNSIFINTDKDPNWELLGLFDYSNTMDECFCPKAQPNNQSKHVQYRVVNENLFYFKTMCQSKYVLCPIGDGAWSFRWYEVLMCKSIPIVDNWHDTYRTKEEAMIKYSVVFQDEIEKNIDYEDCILHNTQLFEKFHFL